MIETAQILRKNAKKPQMAIPAIDTVLFYAPDVVSATDYYPFSICRVSNWVNQLVL